MEWFQFQDRNMVSSLICLLWFIISLHFYQVDSFAITGVSAGVNQVTGERPLRRDINELYMSGPAWDLFILALHDFQETSQDDPFSYYQIAGKHPCVWILTQFLGLTNS